MTESKISKLVSKELFNTQKMDYSKSFRDGMRIIHAVFTFLGINVFKKDFHFTWRTLGTMSVTAIGLLGVLSTIFYHRHDFGMCLKVLISASEALQGVLTEYILFTNPDQLISLYEFLDTTFTRNAKTNSFRAKALINCARHYRLCLQMNLIVLAIAFAALSSTPVYSYLSFSKKELFVELHIPMYPPVDDKSYFINLGVQLFQIVAAFFGNGAFNLMVFTLIIHLSLPIGLFIATLHELNQHIEENTAGSLDGLIRDKLRNACIMHQDSIEYISMLNRMLHSMIFFVVAAASISLAANCFCVVKTDWVGAYGLGAFSSVKIFMLCIVGSYVEYLCDEMLDGIYKLNWYNLPTDCQKTVVLLLLRSQNFTKLTIANVAELNIETGVKIFKGIFSYLMFLLSVEE